MEKSLNKQVVGNFHCPLMVLVWTKIRWIAETLEPKIYTYVLQLRETNSIFKSCHLENDWVKFTFGNYSDSLRNNILNKIVLKVYYVILRVAICVGIWAVLASSEQPIPNLGSESGCHDHAHLIQTLSRSSDQLVLVHAVWAQPPVIQLLLHYDQVSGINHLPLLF